MNKLGQLGLFEQRKLPQDEGGSNAARFAVEETISCSPVRPQIRSEQLNFFGEPVRAGRERVMAALITKGKDGPTDIIPKEKGFLVFMEMLNEALRGFHYGPGKGRASITDQAVRRFNELKPSQYTMGNFRAIIAAAKANRQDENFYNGAPYRDAVDTARAAGVSRR